VSETFDRLDLTAFEETKRAKTYRFRTGRIDNLDPALLPKSGGPWSTC
jgi:hypothetical protein